MTSLSHHIQSFEQRLRKVDVDAVSPSSYCQRYLSHILEHSRYFLEMYARLLDHSIRLCHQSLKDLRFLDYGAGNGLLGLFARHVGIGEVYINDINPVFVEASRHLSEQLGISINGFITGDMEEVCRRMSATPPDIIGGTDVIEHIYDLDVFFQQVRLLNPRMVSAFSTAANPYNPVKKRRILALQQQDENEGSQPTDSLLSGEEAHPSYRMIRREIILSLLPSLSGERLEQLITRTRGLRQDDIKQALDRYKESNELPDCPRHPFNTCHPLTGSWTERLLSTEEYRAIYQKAGFKLTLKNGHYDIHKKPFYRTALHQVLNACIPLGGKSLAPYLILVGNSTVINEI